MDSGDIITVHINCNKWTCKFRINGKMVGSKFDYKFKHIIRN